MDGYRELYAGKYCSIWASDKAIRKIRKATPADRAKTKRYLEEFAENGHENLNEKQFKFEGRYSSGGPNSKEIPVWAAKGNQLRIYGGEVEHDGKLLLCVETTIKKQNKANRSQLERVAKKVGDIQNGNE